MMFDLYLKVTKKLKEIIRMFSSEMSFNMSIHYIRNSDDTNVKLTWYTLILTRNDKSNWATVLKADVFHYRAAICFTIFFRFSSCSFRSAAIKSCFPRSISEMLCCTEVVANISPFWSRSINEIICQKQNQMNQLISFFLFSVVCKSATKSN